MLTCGTGCGTVMISATGRHPSGPVYPATTLDAACLAMAVQLKWDSDLVGSEGQPSFAKKLAMNVPFGLFALVDLPLALATDTVLLPLDWYRHEKRRSRTPKGEPEHAGGTNSGSASASPEQRAAPFAQHSRKARAIPCRSGPEMRRPPSRRRFRLRGERTRVRPSAWTG